MLRIGVAWVALLYAGVVGAAVEGPGRNQFIRAARASGPITVDGKLDESPWATAPLFDAFLQRFPFAGQSPSERTELRVLYDEDTVYFGIIARDSQPALIDRRLGRRDSVLTTDTVRLIIDPTHDHRTAYYFSLSAGGVQGDGLFYDDRLSTSDWDGVWDGAAGRVEEGWVAEFAIPLSLLRFPENPVQTWGFSVRREIPRKNEEIESVDNPRTSNATVSRLGHLTGLEGLQPRSALELVPYVAMRAITRPQFADEARPTPRLTDPTLDVGVDLKAALTSDLALNATINPDFGQVEADERILNLSTFETLFPEKRPFFTQGLELFEPTGKETGEVPQTLFYSRRIGLETPILAAAKLTGTVTKGVEVGVLDALVASPWMKQNEEVPDRRVRLHLTRPLRLGPNSALPGSPQPPMNFLAAVVRGALGEHSRVGGSLASAVPLTRACRPEDAALDEAEQPAACLAQGGLAGAVDFTFKTADSEYGLLGQLAASQVVGGLPERTLFDSTVLRRGDSGWGGYLRTGKFGGEGFRWDVGYDFSTPTLELNATGFQRTQNEHAPRLGLHYYLPGGPGPLREVLASFTTSSQWTTDGRGIYRGSFFSGKLTVQLPSFDVVGLEVGTDIGGYDVRELDFTGIPLEREKGSFASLSWETHQGRAFSLFGYGSVGKHYDRAPVPSRWGWDFNLGFALRPHPSLETRLELKSDRTPFGPRLVQNLGDSRFALAALESNLFSVTLRQQWVITPRLTLQGYAQLFTVHGAYDTVFEGVSDAQRSAIRLTSLQPTSAATADDFYDAALNINLVLRWEYRLGSTLFLVYSRAQTELEDVEGQAPPRTVLPRRLLSGPANDAVLLKWSYYWDL